MDAEANSGACSEYEPKLEDYLSGQLPGADAKDLADHLAKCAGCRSAVQAAAPAARLLSMAERTPDPGPEFARLTMARINEEVVARLFSAAEPTPDPGPGFARITMARIRQEIADEATKGFWQPFVALAWRFAATVAVALALTLSYEAVREHQPPAPATVAQARLNDMRYMFTAEQDAVPSTRDDVLIMVAEAKHGNH
jgi:anti-sigma factor RsiW